MKKEQKRTSRVNKAMYVIVGLVFAAVIVLLAVAIPRTPVDGLLEVCWLPDGKAQYVNDMNAFERACDEPKTINWGTDNLLVVVMNDGEVYSISETPGSVRYAIDLVNFQLGTHLTITNSVRDADILIDWHAAYEIGEDRSRFADAHGFCEHIQLESGKMIANMSIRTLGTIALEGRATVHELGHCIGLTHSSFGIMQPSITTDSDFVMFSDSQRSLIKKLYID